MKRQDDISLKYNSLATETVSQSKDLRSSTPDQKSHRGQPIPGNSASHQTIGQLFDPCREVCGFYAPDIVARQTDLTDGQKRLYERGVRWAGTNGAFWYSFDAMAAELGKSPRQVKRDMAELENRGLMQHERRGKRISNLYRFLYHPMFGGEVTSAAHHRHGEVTDLSGEVTSTTPSDVPPAAHESCKENLVKEVKESSSEASATVQELATAETTDDDSPISQKTEKPNPQDRDRLVETAREQLQMARAAGMSFAGVISQETLAQVKRPDRAITVQILEAFSDYDDFTAWLESTVSRGLARKAKSATWGLYLADAKNQAEDLRLKREAEEKRERDWEIARERQQQADAAAVAELDQPMPALQAFTRIQTRVPALPRVLKARLTRTGELISPNALEAQARGWKRCPDCHDGGMIGDAIDKTLAFCGCPAGIEETCIKGADWPTQEMTRVHSDAKSLLVAACHAVGCLFTADAIADSKVSDCGGVVEIRLPDGHFGIDQGDVRKVAERLKWQRRIVIPGGRQQPQPAPAAKPEAAAPARPPITQADIDSELAKRRQKIPPQMEAGCDLAARAAAGGI